MRLREPLVELETPHEQRPDLLTDLGQFQIAEIHQREVGLPDTCIRRCIGGIDLDTVQKYVNHWYSSSLDLFGGEISTNAADYFASGLKGREHEDRFSDHVALHATYRIPVIDDGRLSERDVPLRNAMNEVLRDAYIDDNQRGVDRWNRMIREAGVNYTIIVPAGTYSVTASAFGYVSQTASGVVVSDGGTTTRNFALVAAPSATVNGHVRTASGDPIPNATVTIGGTPIPPATTDATGFYSFPSVPQGTYSMTATAGRCNDPQAQVAVVNGNITVESKK